MGHCFWGLPLGLRQGGKGRGRKEQIKMVARPRNQPYITSGPLGRGFLLVRPSKPLRMSVRPVASHTRTPLGTGIIAVQLGQIIELAP
jgi:hypothetical protein